MPEHSIDCIVTDPPAGIDFMGKDWDNLSNHGAKTERGRKVAPVLEMLQHLGYLQTWEAGFLLFTVDWASEALRVAKPGANSLTWAIPRTSDLTKFGLRLAGWQIRDTVYHLFGSGFPKSLDICKNMDDMDLARQWHGWGTALKPGAEEWILARKPLAGTVAQNALAWGVAGLNIDGCRVPITDGATMARNNKPGDNGWKNSSGGKNNAALHGEPNGRWPANVVHDGSDEVVSLFPDSISRSGGTAPKRSGGIMGKKVNEQRPRTGHDDTGSAARFFYCAKASTSERTCGGEVDNDHPTVKPQALMRWLCRLVSTPTGGVLLDPFMGSGSTIIAAVAEGMTAIGIDKDPHNVEIARQRLERTAVQLPLEV